MAGKQDDDRPLVELIVDKKYEYIKGEKFKVTPEFLNKVQEMGALGMKQKFIADYFCVPYAVWRKRCEKNPDITAAFLQGRSSTVKFVTNKLLELVQKGNVTAIIFWLKANAEMTELVRAAEQNPDKPAEPAPDLTGKDPIEAARIYQQIMIKG